MFQHLKTVTGDRKFDPKLSAKVGQNAVKLVLTASFAGS